MLWFPGLSLLGQAPMAAFRGVFASCVQFWVSDGLCVHGWEVAEERKWEWGVWWFTAIIPELGRPRQEGHS